MSIAAARRARGEGTRGIGPSCGRHNTPHAPIRQTQAKVGDCRRATRSTPRRANIAFNKKQHVGQLRGRDRRRRARGRGAGGRAGAARHLVCAGRAAPDAAADPQGPEPHESNAGALLLLELRRRAARRARHAARLPDRQRDRLRQPDEPVLPRAARGSAAAAPRCGTSTSSATSDCRSTAPRRCCASGCNSCPPSRPCSAGPPCASSRTTQAPASPSCRPAKTAAAFYSWSADTAQQANQDVSRLEGQRVVRAQVRRGLRWRQVAGPREHGHRPWRTRLRPAHGAGRPPLEAAARVSQSLPAGDDLPGA